jgi:hypothetical protein
MLPKVRTGFCHSFDCMNIFIKFVQLSLWNSCFEKCSSLSDYPFPLIVFLSILEGRSTSES